MIRFTLGLVLSLALLLLALYVMRDGLIRLILLGSGMALLVLSIVLPNNVLPNKQNDKQNASQTNEADDATGGEED